MNPVKLGVTFEPWCGTEYQSKIQGHQLLIIGESHFHCCTEDRECMGAADRDEYHRNLTWSAVDFWKDHPHSSPLSTALPSLFDMDKKEFWERVSFYNYLQEFAGERARQRPKPEQWDDRTHFGHFQTVLDALKPDRILVLGKGTWQNMPGAAGTLFKEPDPEPRLHVAKVFGRTALGEEIGCWYHLRSGGRALAIPIHHPASPGFRTEDWTETASKLLLPY